MNDHRDDQRSSSKIVASALASCAFTIPLLLSSSSAPSPQHPRTMLWYTFLRKPGFKPPDWTIPLVWTGIESGLAFAAYRLLRSPPSPSRRRALGWWGWNVFMIGAWSRLFFHHRQLPVSSLAAASMVGTASAFVKEAHQVDRVAARAGIPLVAWVAFATVLTGTIWALNRKQK